MSNPSDLPPGFPTTPDYPDDIPNVLFQTTPRPPGYVAEPTSDAYMAARVLDWGEGEIDTNPPV